MIKEDISPTALELFKLCQLQDSYISFLELAITEPQSIAMIHGWTPKQSVITTGDQIRKLITGLKEFSKYEEMKNIVVPSYTNPNT